MIDEAALFGCSYICVCQANISSITEELVSYASNKNVRVWVWGSTTITQEIFDNSLKVGVTGWQMTNPNINVDTIQSLKAKIENNQRKK